MVSTYPSPTLNCRSEMIMRVQACLLSGAIGDALGAPVEFMSSREIQRDFGLQGICEFAPAYGRIGSITDDTQMMLFSAEGLIRGVVRGYTRGISSISGVVHHALLRWLITQHVEPDANIAPHIDRGNGLILNPALWSCRAPGTTCLSSLRASKHFGEAAVNDRKGCGGVMRSAPFAFWSNSFDNAAECARLTHGHQTGYLSAGLFAEILSEMFASSCTTPTQLLSIVKDCLVRNQRRDGMGELSASISEIVNFVEWGYKPDSTAIDSWGAGWVADEALAIGLWCALGASSLEEGIIMAVNHGGDSDSTGLIAGHLLGLMYGLNSIPDHWLQYIELKDAVSDMAQDLIEVPLRCMEQGEDLDDEIFDQYPGF